jgi:hypothetical protein
MTGKQKEQGQAGDAEVAFWLMLISRVVANYTLKPFREPVKADD